jgi:DNA replication protein DnaC
MRLRDDPHLTRQDRTKMLQSVAVTSGTGKTHLATALGHIAIRRRHSVHMARADKLLKRLKAARLDNSVEAEMRRLAHVQLLIIDDFALQPLDATETTDFYELIVERHRKTATVLTSNREPSEWLAMMADPLLAQSAIDRLVSTAHELIIEGDSYRRRQKPNNHTKTGTNTSVSVDQQKGDHHAH